ncbi:MAG: amidase [Gammaproteobacteria bacterium]|nr:amidase [Gammaproteobacteria bacterium]
MADVHYLTLSDVCRRMKSGELTSVHVTEAMLARIGALDGDLKSYIKVLSDSALQSAERHDQARRDGKPLGQLHGVPIAVKDLLCTRGVATASGTKVMENFVPEEDATVIARLQDAGAVIIGKTQLTEGAFGAHHPDVDPPKNPWNPDHWPGVSSSGSGVAVAAGLAFAALGTDTGGSIRFPSACCGLVGIKPTYGRVSRYGAFPLAESLDHIGPMTRSVEDAARVLQVLAGVDPLDPTTLHDPVPNYSAALADQVQGLTVGVDWDFVSGGVDEVVVSTIKETLDVLKELGAQVQEVTLPESYKTLVQGWGITTGVECARAHAPYYPEQKDRYGPVLASLIEGGLAAEHKDYENIERVRSEFTDELNTLLDKTDVLIAPCMTSLPPTLEAMDRAVASEEERAEFITFTAPFDYSGHPTITLPAGFADNGLPKSFQLIGKLLGEPTLIRAGSAYQQARGFSEHPLP